MFFRNGFVFLPLLLSGCGMSLFAHNEYITFSDVDDVTPRQRETFQTEGLVLKGVFSNRKEEVASEKAYYRLRMSELVLKIKHMGLPVYFRLFLLRRIYLYFLMCWGLGVRFLLMLI